MVVIVHATVFWPERLTGSGVGEFRLGAAGVDLFFVISGFVMLYSIKGKETGLAAASRFLAARAIRIFPLYWLVTSLKVAANFIAPEMLIRPGVAIGWIVCSYLLIPAYAPDGKVEPVISVGWTLSFEMMFYMGLAFLIALRANVVVGSFILFGSVATLSMFHLPIGAFNALTNPMVFEFCLGMAAFVLLDRGRKFSVRVASVVSVAAVAAAALTSINFDFETLGQIRLVAWGIPAFFILYAAVSSEDLFMGRAARTVEVMGDASYSIYLTHILTFRVVELLSSKVFKITGEQNLAMILLLMAISIAASALVGIVCYYALEKPVLNFLRRNILRPSRASVERPIRAI